jgi:hypothetical protein
VPPVPPIITRLVKLPALFAPASSATV